MAQAMLLGTLLALTSVLPGQYLAEGRWEAVYVHGWPNLQVTSGFADVSVEGKRVQAELSVGHHGDAVSFAGSVEGEKAEGTITQLHESHRSGKVAGLVIRIKAEGECRVVIQLTDGLHVLVLARSAAKCAI